MLSTLRRFIATLSNMKLDSAVIKALSLDPTNSSVASHGGGGMSSASTLKISTTTADGKPQLYFMKTATGAEAKVMFEGEYASLNAIHNAVPSLCPAALAWGQLTEAPNKYFLVTDFLDLSSRRTSAGASKGNGPMSLAAKMAKLHTTPAPPPEGHDKPMFGFPATTCCGDTPQPNSYKSSWADFYAENRLRFILKESEKHNGKDKDLAAAVTTTIEKVVPRLIGDRHLNAGKGVTPVVVHGDLWSGNAARGIIGAGVDSDGEQKAGPEDVVYDPSACYGHNEYDLGIMNMFGGFGSGFFSEYHKLCPKTEPVEEYQDRVLLYELYHHLNHFALFGGGYRGGAMRIMKDLIKKYGKEKTEL